MMFKKYMDFNRLLMILVLVPSASVGLSGLALADGKASCDAAAGSYLSGIVVRGPTFRDGKSRKGIPLTHTHFTIKGDQDGKLYDVAVNNVFVEGYRPKHKDIPAALLGVRSGDRLALCGELYTGGGAGIHFVHTNCGDRPKPDEPDGWIKEFTANGQLGPNLADAQTYCHLWK